jgi:DNA-directed RNA polymerase specialized sigma24 family protein
MRVVTADLISRARAGDGDAFRELTEPHRRELQVHCYRMLGSFQDAEDALQDTLLAAWQGLGGFEGRASLRTWLDRHQPVLQRASLSQPMTRQGVGRARG